MSQPCNCIEEVDKLLAERNTRLSLALCLRPQRSRLMIATEILEKRRGARPVTMFPSFCPFCGVKYQEQDGAEREAADG